MGKTQDNCNGRIKTAKNSFSLFFDNKLKALKKRAIGKTRKISKKSIASELNIGYEMFRKIVNKQKPTKKRDCIIAISLALQLNSDEVNDALKLYGFSELEPGNDDNNNTRDEFLIDIIEENSGIKMSITDINNMLSRKSFPELDIINHRVGISKHNNDQDYTIGNKEVNYNRSDYLLENPNTSLCNKYGISTRYINISMTVTQNSTKYYLYCRLTLNRSKTSKLSYNYDYRLIREQESHKQKVDTDDEIFYVFRPYFAELKIAAKDEIKKLYSILNDTKNYHDRISARIVDNQLHVFYEIYNYIIPEFGEYYLMDFFNGIYTLHVYKTSSFMQYYMSNQDYCNLYGDLNKSIECYTSIKSIQEAIQKKENETRAEILGLRIKAFSDIKKQIDNMLDTLKSDMVDIRNLDLLSDNSYEVLRYYKVADKYECTYDPNPEFDEIDTPGVDSVLFTLTDGRQVDLSVEDLQNGFRLGLNSIDEIGSFLLEHNTLKIQELL